MYKDAVVEEIHQAREQLLAQCGGSFEAYFDSLIKTQQEHPERYASFALPKLDVENRLIVKSPN